MFSFTLVALALMSAALAAPAYAGFHRENPRLTDNHESDIPGSIPGRSSKNKITKWTDSLVVRTSDFSMSTRVLKGISQPEVLFSGYFDRALAGIAQSVEHMSLECGVPGSIPGPGAISRDTRTVYRLVFGQVVVQLILGLDYVEVRNLLSTLGKLLKQLSFFF